MKMGIMGVKMLITVICDGWGILQLRIINGIIEELVMNPLENLMKQSNLNARNGLLTWCRQEVKFLFIPLLFQNCK